METLAAGARFGLWERPDLDFVYLLRYWRPRGAGQQGPDWFLDTPLLPPGQAGIARANPDLSSARPENRLARSRPPIVCPRGDDSGPRADARVTTAYPFGHATRCRIRTPSDSNPTAFQQLRTRRPIGTTCPGHL